MVWFGDFADMRIQSLWRRCGTVWKNVRFCALLQIPVDFETVVTRVGHNNMTVRRQSQTLRTIQRVCTCVDVREKWTWAVKHLSEKQQSTLSEFCPFLISINCHPNLLKMTECTFFCIERKQVKWEISPDHRDPLFASLWKAVLGGGASKEHSIGPDFAVQDQYFFSWETYKNSYCIPVFCCFPSLLQWCFH